MDGLQPDIALGPQARGFFAGFTFEADQDLDELARFYGLTLSALEPISLGEYLRRIYRGAPQPGYRVAIGCAELCVLEMEEGIVTKVGLRPLLSPARPPRHHPGRYQIGATLFHSGPPFKGFQVAPRTQ